MDTVHDNGRVGDQPDLRDLIDQVGAIVAALAALASSIDDAGAEGSGLGRDVDVKLAFVSDDLTDARWYAARALRWLRELV